MKVFYRRTASDDVVRQFRYYLIDQSLPEVAVRFRDAIRRTIESLSEHPLVGARCHLSSTHLQKLRSWPIAGFEAIRGAIHVIRVLHGKRDLKHILERERNV